MRELFKDREHLVRVVALFIGGLLLFFLMRAVLVPKGFGVYGHYREGALKDNREKPLSFAGRSSCLEACHPKPVSDHAAGAHKGMGCETCHGPLAKHAEEPSSMKPEKPDAAQLCLLCHRENAARPEGFPQVNPKDHAGDTPCTDCHVPHSPSLAEEAAPPAADPTKGGSTP